MSVNISIVPMVQFWRGSDVIPDRGSHNEGTSLYISKYLTSW